MANKYEEIDSYLEINKIADDLKAKGDRKGLEELIKATGIDKEDLEDYDDGVCELATPVTAAIGKIKVEVEKYQIVSVVRDWVSDLEKEVIENPELALAVRKNGKSIAGYIALIVEYSYKHCVSVDKRIVELCPEVKKVMGNHPLTIGAADRRVCRQLIHEYYLGGKS